MSGRSGDGWRSQARPAICRYGHGFLESVNANYRRSLVEVSDDNGIILVGLASGLADAVFLAAVVTDWVNERCYGQRYYP